MGAGRWSRSGWARISTSVPISTGTTSSPRCATKQSYGWGSDSPRGANESGMVSEEQRREIGGVALLAVALFLLLALLPPSLLGSLGAEWFPSGNMMGPTGRLMRDGLSVTFGASMFLPPALFLIGGLKTGGWLAGDRANRLVLLAVGLL